ncbi:MAG: peptidase M13, partial [Caulobacteraceae bacterium]
MKRFHGVAVVAAACALGLVAFSQPLGGRALAAPSAAPAPSPRFPPWGFDLTGRDTAVSPGTNFYDYANGDYVKRLVIPPDRARYGNFDALQELSEDRVHTILETAADDPKADASEAKIGAFYSAFMDEKRADALGAAPLAHDLALIRAARTRPAIAALMGKAPGSLFGAAFSLDIEVDSKNPGRYAVDVSQAGLGLPNRDYYLDPRFAPQKAEYQAYVGQMLKLAGWPDADAQAKGIVDLETKIAKASWTVAEDRDPIKTYNPMTPAALAAAAPGFDWAAFLKSGGVASAKQVVVAETTALPK